MNTFHSFSANSLSFEFDTAPPEMSVDDSVIPNATPTFARGDSAYSTLPRQRKSKKKKVKRKCCLLMSRAGHNESNPNQVSILMIRVEQWEMIFFSAWITLSIPLRVILSTTIIVSILFSTVEALKPRLVVSHHPYHVLQTTHVSGNDIFVNS